MKKRIILSLMGFVLSMPAYAQEETAYVRDELYINMYAGQGSGERIRAGMRSGTALTVLEQSEDEVYTRVRTSNGEQGWVQAQYLSSNPAARTLLEAAQQRATDLAVERDSLQARLGELENNFDASQAALEVVTTEAATHSQQLEELRAVSSNAIQLNEENSRLLTENSVLSTQLEAVSTESALLEAEVDQKGFMQGALAVLLGVIITLLVPRLWPSKRTDWR